MRDTLNAPDYWQTDNSNGLVMVIRNYHWLNSGRRVLISTCSAPLVQTGEHKQFSLFDLDIWPTTLTYNPRLAKVMIDPRAKKQGQRSNGSNRRAPTDKRRHSHTHGRYQTYYLPCYAIDNQWSLRWTVARLCWPFLLRIVTNSSACASVCLSVRVHISRTTRPYFIKLSTLIAAVFLWRNFDRLCTSVLWMTSCFTQWHLSSSSCSFIEGCHTQPNI